MPEEKLLTDFLEKLRDHRPYFSSRLPKHPRVKKPHDLIKERYGGNDVTPPIIDEEIEHRLYEAYKRKELALARLRDLKRAPTLLFTGTENLLKNNQKFLATFHELVLQRQSRALWNALISTYCFLYDPKSPLIRSIADLLHRHVDERRGELRRRWRRLPYLARLFELKKAPKTIADFILNNAEDPVFQAQESMGLTGPLLGSPLMRQAYIEGAKIIKTDIENSNLEKLDRFLAWICKGQDTNQSITKNAGTAALLGLVGPFREEPNITDPNTRSSTINTIKQLLHRSYGHHHLDAAEWPHIKNRKDYLRVVSQWWVPDTLKLFFKIIGRHAAYQWERRREFWFNYLEEGRIDDAWVICTRSPAQTAREVQNRDNELDMRFGRLKGAKDGQSVLLMQIGRLTIVEWSDSGACGIWNEDNLNKPAHKEIYDQTELRSATADFRQIHHQSKRPNVRRSIRPGRRLPWNVAIKKYIEDNA